MAVTKKQTSTKKRSNKISKETSKKPNRSRVVASEANTQNLAEALKEKKVENRTGLKATLNRNKWYILIGVVILGLLLALFARKFLVIAMVNGSPIWREDYIKQMEVSMGEQVLDNLVVETLVKQKAAQEGVEVSQERMDQEIAEIETQLTASGQSLDQVLALQGMSREELEEQLKIRTLIEEMAIGETQVSQEEIAAYLEENSDVLPEEMEQTELEEMAREQLEGEKLNQQVQDWISQLREAAQIVTFN